MPGQGFVVHEMGGLADSTPMHINMHTLMHSVSALSRARARAQQQHWLDDLVPLRRRSDSSEGDMSRPGCRARKRVCGACSSSCMHACGLATVPNRPILFSCSPNRTSVR